MILLKNFSGAIEQSSPEQGRLIETIIYVPLLYILLPILIILWLTFFIQRYMKHKPVPKLLKFNFVSTMIFIIFFLCTSPIIEFLFGELSF